MIALYLMLVASALCALRLLLGPRAPDRIIAFDAMSYTIITAIVLLGVQSQAPMLLDIAIAYTLLSFIGTIAIAKYLEGDELHR